ncbi:MAG: hypothetical protein AAFO74_16000 [Pseudomonadota bacterium]
MKHIVACAALGLTLGVSACSSSLKYASSVETFGKTVSVATLSDAEDARTSIREWKLTEKGNQQLSDVELKQLACIPLVIAADVDEHRKLLQSLSKSLSKTASASPTTVVGLFGSIASDKDFIKDNEGDTDKAKTNVFPLCSNVISEIAAGGPIGGEEQPTLDGLFAVEWNRYANNEGLTASGSDLTGLASALRSVLISVLTIADQTKREEKLLEFFRQPNGELLTAIGNIDEMTRAIELTGRTKAKVRVRLAWQSFGTNTQPASYKQREELLEALSQLDRVTMGVIRDESFKNKTYSINQKGICPGAPALADGEESPVKKCDYSPIGPVGASLYAAVDKLQKRADTPWSKLTAEQKQKEVEAMFAFLGTLSTLQSDLAKFENNKESHVFLTRVLDAID